MGQGTSPGSSTSGRTRRRLLAGVAAGVTGVGAGCGGDQTNATPTPTRTTPEFTDRPIEVLHGWTGGDGAVAIRSVERMFRARHPDVRVDFRPIGGTGNENLNAVIDRRLENDNPPSSFATWPGPTLAKYDGQLASISSVWADGDLEATTLGRVAEYCRRDGEYLAVPIGSHRVNNLFYNVGVLEDAGVDVSGLTSVAGLQSALERIATRTDAVPMAHAMQAPWTNLQFVVAVLLSQDGNAAYRRFVAEEGERDVVRRALETTRTLLTRYINEDASTIGFTEANRKLIRGEAGVISQGSWVYGMYRAADSLRYGEDWGWVPFPGTGHLFGLNLDTFVFPRENPTPRKKDVWARFVSKPGPQIAFSNRKGSIPVRTDFDSERLAAFPRLLWRQLVDAETLVPTLAHGLAVEPRALARCKSVVQESFMGPFDVEGTADGLLEALTR